MTSKEIQTHYDQAVRYLDDRELKKAFGELKEFTSDPRTFMFSDELNNLQETYKQLLHYYAEGYNDPMRAKIYNELLASTYEIADKITQKLLIDDTPGMYYSLRRSYDIHAESISNLANTARSSYDIDNIALAEASVAQLFKRIWTSASLSESDMKELETILMYDNSNPAPKFGYNYMTMLNCQIVSALTLGLQESFDKRKMNLLITAAGSNDEEVKIRAYTGILITLYSYKSRIDCYTDIKHRLDNLSESPDFRRIVYLIILQFILSRETEKISNKIKEEIIPEIMKLHPKFNPDISSSDISPDNTENEMNPEWMEKISDTPLGKKMEELNNLHEEGADLMHSTFIHLKYFPFFNEISNWLMPFNKKQSLISEDDTIIKSLDLITNNGFICNSDLYSLYFSLKHIPEEGRKMMIGQLESQLSELKQQKLTELQTRNEKTEKIIGCYVQDLYRFYKLYKRQSEFKDIFTQKLDFHNLQILQQYFSDRNDLLNIAELYLRKNYFDDALTIYERLSETTSENNEMLFQKKGFCKQMTGDHEGALAEYAKAEIINPESKWLLRRTAQCYRAVKKPEKAIDYYLHYERLDKENLSVLLSIGSCYLEMKNYAEALKYFFKVDYLDQDRGKAWRPIAWCSFITGRYDQARKYYNKLLLNHPDSQDYINAGHTEWVLQNIKGALDFYKKSVSESGSDYESFKTEFNKDMPELIAAGVDAKEIPIALDKIRYMVES